ncbi:MAG: hypothetical protein LBI13_10420 [Streptococcaceae bacterium]|jgi:hypothetical protein|nr:hypothetical protein [Streptococcaceae bacterium]
MEIFTEEQAQQIVDTLKLGYNVYIQERLDKKRDMFASSGYAWVRGNIIDDAFVKANLGFINNPVVAIAGQSWEYVKFNVQHEEHGKILFLVKNGTRLNTREPSGYLLDYAKANRSLLKEITTISSESDKNTNWNDGEQLAFDLGIIEGNDFEGDFDCFFILAFELGEDKQINSVAVTALDEQGSLHVLQNLSQYIQSSPIEPIQGKDEEIRGLGEELDERQVFGYGVPIEREEAN